MNMINKLKKRNNDSIGVLGSGLMGHGIAYTAAISGFNVLMLDLTRDQAAMGLQKIYQILDKNLKNVNVGDLVGFTPQSKYEFIIDGERLYRVLTKFVTVKYEREGNEEEYNPSWT